MLYTSAESDESRIAVANAWASRRGSQPRMQSDREKIALDITILKKQYEKLRERQKQINKSGEISLVQFIFIVFRNFFIICTFN